MSNYENGAGFYPSLLEYSQFTLDREIQVYSKSPKSRQSKSPQAMRRRDETKLPLVELGCLSPLARMVFSKSS